MNPPPPSSPSEVLLLGPGPSPVPPLVSQALAAPVLGHLDAEFIALMDGVQADLRRLFGAAEDAFTLPLSGTGSAGMEACLSNLVESGDRVVIGVHGVFGARMVELAGRLGAEVVPVEAPFGQPLDETAMAAAIAAGPTRLVAFVHAETSTGVLQPCAEIVAAARAAGALVLADCVTSLGGVPVDVRADGFDAAFSGTQKCLSVPPGLAPVTLSAPAMERVAARRRRPPTWYLDFALLGAYWNDGGASRAYHHTAPVSMIYALARGLELVHAEGLPARFARHRAAGEALTRAIDALGLRCAVAAEHRLPQLTTVLVPDGVDAERVRIRLRAEHRIEIGGGLGSMRGGVWRIGLMGHGARLDVVRRLVAALGAVLAAEGHRCDPAQAVAQVGAD